MRKRELKIKQGMLNIKKCVSQEYHFLVKSADMGKEGDQLTVCLAQGSWEGGVLGFCLPGVVAQRVTESMIDRDHLLRSR